MLHLLLLSPAYALPDFDSAPTWEAYGDGTSARLGSVVLGVGDVNGDGYDDIAIARMEGGVHIHVHHGTAVGPYYDSAWDLALGSVAGWGMYEVNPPIASGDFNGDGYGDLVVGIPDGSSLNNATVYFGSPSGLSVNAGWQHFGGSGEGYGSCVAALNANNDAFSDLVVCAAQKAVTYTNEGECSLYLGSTVGPSGTAATTLVGNLSGGRFGSACGRAGDVNGDGYEDLLVSAPSAGSGAANGRFYVYHGRSTGLRTTASRSYGAEYGGGGMWSSAVGIGDVNGDGYDDIASGMPWAENGINSEGRVWVFHGSSLGLPARPAWVADGNAVGANFGTRLSGGDADGDGYADLAVGAPSFDNAGVTDVGRVDLFRGSASGLSPYADLSLAGTMADACLSSVALGADVNGDGLADLAVGAPGYNQGEENEGAVFLWLSTVLGEVADTGDGGVGGLPPDPRELPMFVPVPGGQQEAEEGGFSCSSAPAGGGLVALGLVLGLLRRKRAD